MRKLICIFLSLMVVSCDNIENIVSYDRDLKPPAIRNLLVESNKSIIINCNETIYFIEKAYLSREGIEIESCELLDNSLKLNFETDMTPGKEYCSEFKIEDKNGNSLSFIAKYYGYNGDIPGLLINEFICKGTKSNPDKIEILVKKAGSMAGVTVFNGVSSDYDSKFVFPDIYVNKGEYIVLRAVSEKYPDEFIETDNINVVNDKKFIKGVRDIRTSNFSLSSTNGVISLYTEPFGSIIDAVVYSKNRNNEEKKNRNFGLKKTVDRVDIIGNSNEWEYASGCIFPDDTISIEKSTTTRSLNRKSELDTNSENDWYTVPTMKSTFGFINCTETY